MVDKNTVSSHTGHKARLRERFAKEPLAIPDYEILEMLLGYVLIRKDTKPLAKDLLAHFGSLRGVLDARAEELAQISGFGPSLALYIRLLRELLARYAAAPALQRERLTDPLTVARMARARLASSPHEECWLALLDSQNRLLAWERLRTGGISSVQIAPRDVLEVALRYKASAIILVHNHPGGDARPSVPDLDMTHALRAVSDGLSIRFLDHVIVTENSCYSLARGDILDDTGEL